MTLSPHVGIAVLAAMLSVPAMAQGDAAQQAALADAFGVGSGFAGGMIAAQRKPLPSPSEAQVAVAEAPGVRVEVFQAEFGVLPISVHAYTPEGVRTVSKLLSEFSLAGALASFGPPESRSADSLRYRGPAENCSEYLELRFKNGSLASARWEFCWD
ncbi:hypothetical protein E4K72_09055 [Oxalobacteraceae bacterium OM1]|nr:hypothetical protein E4K72_09055 [Oxalobacteraceae bacterium OM1]